MKKIIILLGLIFAFGYLTNNTTYAKNIKDSEKSTISYYTLHGYLLSEKTGKALPYAAISLEGTNIATITNSDGEFTLKIDKNTPQSQVLFSHIGYKNKKMNINLLKDKSKNKIFLDEATIPLKEITIRPKDAASLIHQIINKIPTNYSKDPNLMTGFYREIIKKRRAHISISEAVVDVYKAPYNKNRNDQVKILKGRKSTDVSKMDTILFKYQGGPKVMLLIDIVKNPYIILSPENIQHYDYEIKDIVNIDEKMHYIIEFTQVADVNTPLYYGKFYVDLETLAISRAEFDLNLQNKAEARKFLVKKTPWGLKINPKKVNYLVKYKQKGGKYYFDYARCELKFKCKWRKKWFATTYSTISELAITNRTVDNVVKFDRNERFRVKDVFAEKVNYFEDKNFWGNENIIEPDRSIESAIKKINKKLKNLR